MSTPKLPRRTVLQSAAGLAFSQLAATTATAAAQEAKGEIGDFNFLAGNWSIQNRRLKTPGTNDWDEFPGEATVWTVLGGVGSIEELRIPARNFSGIGIRLLDIEKHVWADFWVNGKSGVLSPPPLTGVFKNGAGIFEADDMDGDKPIRVRGVWDRITPKSCRWYQAISRDAGKTWAENWVMAWTRV
jgi:hypothetical protein